MNIVYGFGGMRSDGKRLSFQPSLPGRWTSYSFQVLYEGVLLKLEITKDSVRILAASGGSTEIIMNGKQIKVGADRIELPLGEGMMAG
ncbi:Maltose phosphorylase [compost metagenome]